MIRVALLCLALLALGPSSYASDMVVPGVLDCHPLDANAVATGATAVTAMKPGTRTAGGWLFNPVEATVPLCINERGTASGTVSQGDLTCIAPGTPYGVGPGIGPVSVVSSDSTHKFSGQECLP